MFLKNLLGLHVENFCNPALHDEEVRIVDIQLNRPKQVLNPGVVGSYSIDHVLVPVSDGYLSEISIAFRIKYLHFRQ